MCTKDNNKMTIDFNEYFYYDETSPSCLRWKVDTYSGQHYKILNKRKTDIAGGLPSPDNYWIVSLNNRLYRVHRIIWELLYNPIPEGYMIDHLDGNRQNNLITNLRIVGYKENARNAKMGRKNTSGKVGVYKISIDNKYQQATQWRVRWNDLDGKTRIKSFSVQKYGDEGAFNLACDYRDKIILELNAQGAGYTERHGK